jgi:hypothetical protein
VDSFAADTAIWAADTAIWAADITSWEGDAFFAMKGRVMDEERGHKSSKCPSLTRMIET